MTYFHIDKVDTSIGAERFHFRVRKGIGWFPLAMAARQNGAEGPVMSGPSTNSYNLFRALKLWLEWLHSRSINQVDPIHDLPTLKANRLGVIWSSLTGN